MSLDFLKRALKAAFSDSVEQQVTVVPKSKVNHVWLDILAEHSPTPDDPPKEFEAYFACVEEAVRARTHVPIGPSGRVRTSAPLYQLPDKEAAQKTEAIFRAVFEHEDWALQSRDAMDAAWKSVPRSLMKLSFSNEEDSLFTPATIYKTAQSKIITTPQQHSARLYNLADYRHPSQPTPPDDGGAAVFVVEYN